MKKFIRSIALAGAVAMLFGATLASCSDSSSGGGGGTGDGGGGGGGKTALSATLTWNKDSGSFIVDPSSAVTVKLDGGAAQTNGYRMSAGASYIEVTIPGLKAGQKVEFTASVLLQTDKATIAKVSATNTSEPALTGNSFTAKNNTIDVKGTCDVTADGDVVLKFQRAAVDSVAGSGSIDYKGFSFKVTEPAGSDTPDPENPDPVPTESAFKTISEMEGKIVAENFDDMADGTKLEALPDGYVWGTSEGAIYAQYADDTDNFTVTSGKAVQAASKNGSLYIDLGETEGQIIEGCADVAVSALGTSWNLISFKNTKDGSTDATKFDPYLFSIYNNNADGTISYTFDGKTDTPAKTTVKFETGKLYSVRYKINVASGEVKVWIGDKLIVDDYGDFEDLAFIEIISSNKGARKLTLDNIAVAKKTATAKDLKDGATAQVAEIEALLDTMKGSAWTDAGTADALAAAKTKAEAAIADVADNEDLAAAGSALDDALETAYGEIVAALVDEYKARADAYADEKYSSSASLATAKTTAAGIIEAVEDIEDFEDVLANAKQAIDDACAAKVTLALSGTGLTATAKPCNQGQVIADEDALKKLTEYTLASGKGIKGWYTDAAKTTAVTFPLTINVATTLYADVGTSKVVTIADLGDLFGDASKSKIDGSSDPDEADKQVKKSDGDTQTVGGFTFIYSGSSKTSISKKTWADGSELERRIIFGGKAALDSSDKTKVAKNAIKFTTTTSARVRIWAASNGAAMSIQQIASSKLNDVVVIAAENGKDSSNNTLLDITNGDTGVAKNVVFFGDVTIPADKAGDLYISGNNYIYKVEVIE